jgi:hypothetical protein
MATTPKKVAAIGIRERDAQRCCHRRSQMTGRHGVQAGHRGRIDGRDGMRIPQTAAIHGAVIDPALCEVEVGERDRRSFGQIGEAPAKGHEAIERWLAH